MCGDIVSDLRCLPHVRSHKKKKTKQTAPLQLAYVTFRLHSQKDTPIGRQIVQAEAKWTIPQKIGTEDDKDEHVRLVDEEIRYKITNMDNEQHQMLRVDERSGAIFTAQEFDYEQQKQYTLLD
uniref:Cadherin domain-containing protein n=1 Tax=Globodera rostochiensis TaxID=31243 RepID=A0A914I8X1_GLORO